MEINTARAPQQPREPVEAGSEEATESSSDAPYSSDSASPSDPEVLRKLYENMLACRLLRERVRALDREGSLSGTLAWPPAEAMEVGATFELKPQDSLAIHQHDLVTYTLKGLPWKQVFAMPRSERDAAAQPAILPPALLPAASSIVAQLNVAVGVAVAYRQQQQRNVVVALCGDAVAALGSWHDAARLAGELRLPVIFVVESGRSSAPPSQEWFSSEEHLSQRAHDYGFPGITVDGEDVVAVFRVTQESIHRARTGAGPTLIECALSPSRQSAKSAGNGARRGKSERKDALAHMEHYLRKRNAWNESWKQQLVERITREIDSAVSPTRRSRSSSQ